MIDRFRFTPEPIMTYPENKPDFSRKQDSTSNLVGYQRIERNVYKYICEFVYCGRVDDYINQPKYSGLLSSYKSYKLNMAREHMTPEQYANYYEEFMYKSPQVHQREIAQSVYETGEMLAKKYEYLDALINDDMEPETDDEFSYQGSTEFWLYAHNNTLNKALLPQHNEYSRWLYILMSLTKSELRKLNNPYIIHTFLNRMFVHPALGIQYDITLNKSKQSYAHRRVTSGLRKRFATSIENYKKLRREGKVFQEESNLGLVTAGYVDGEDLQTGITMYTVAVRFNNAMLKYEKPAVSHQCSLFLGYQDRRSIATTANQVGRYRADLEMKLNTPPDQMEPGHYEVIQRKVDHYSRFQQARQHLVDLQSIPAEEILLNPNAKNVAGPMYMLKSLENGSWNEPKEEVQERKLVVEFKGAEDFGLTPG